MNDVVTMKETHSTLAPVAPARFPYMQETASYAATLKALGYFVTIHDKAAHVLRLSRYRGYRFLGYSHEQAYRLSR